MSLIDAKDFKDVIDFGRNLKKLIVITRGEKELYQLIAMKLSKTVLKKI